MFLIFVGLATGCEEATAEGVIRALRRGDYECAVATAKLTPATTANENAVLLELRTLETAIKEVKDSLKPSSLVAPAYQWAQSADDLFVSVKFAHKIDAPATLVSKLDLVEFKNSSVALRASKNSKQFALDLVLLRAIEPDNCTWSSASVGRATLTLRKAKLQDWWPRLLLTRAKPPNQHVWWDKQDMFTEEL